MSEQQSTDSDQRNRIAGYVDLVKQGHIARTELGDVTVSTRWIGLTERRYIETMILGGPLDQQTVGRHYDSEIDALRGHGDVVVALTEGRTPNGLVG